MTDLQRKDALMPATYSSFDTLTIGQFEGDAGHGGPMLPVLAEIPTLVASPPKAASVAPVESPAEPAREPEIAAPRFQAAVAEPAVTAPAPAPSHPQPTNERRPTHQQAARQPMAPLTEPAQPTHEADWEDGGWAAQLLALEASLRPHARLILLAALIAITGLMLVVLRAPTPTLPESLPANVVDSPHAAPALTDAGSQTMLASDEQPVPRGVADRLDPMPSFPSIGPAQQATAPTGSATITSAGPVGMPVAQASSGAGASGITPLEPHRTATAPTQPQDESQVRVAQRPAYPSTNFSSSWPAPYEAAPASSNPPQAVLQSPAKPYNAGSPQ